MFSLHDFTKVKVLEVQVLSQKNRPPGANPGVRLNLQADLPNYVLSAFDGALRTALFTKSAAAETDKDKRQTLPGIDPVSDLPHLTSIARHVRKIPWSETLTGYDVTIDHGMGGKSNLNLADAKLENFRFQAKEGGTVSAWWSVEVVDVPKLVLGELSVLKSREVPMTFCEPEVQQQDLDDGAEEKGPSGEVAWPFPNDPVHKEGKPETVTPIKGRRRLSQAEKTAEQQFLDTAGKQS